MADLNQPRRACRLVLDLEADDRQGIADALYGMASRIERGEMSRGVSGGYSSGYVYELVENDSPSHDEFFKRLTAYLDAKKATDTTGVKTVDGEQA